MQKPSLKRQRAYRLGKYSEYWVMIWLFLKGYRVLEHRLKTPLGEIDIVARRGSMLVFVEVKARQNRAQFFSAISPQQQKRLVHAAELYKAKRFPSLSARFDVMMVNGFYIRHFYNVF